MLIPIQNIYYLLSYAWDKVSLLPQGQLVGSEPGKSVINLLAGMLLPEVQLLFTHGLATDYLIQTRPVRGIKGKLLLNQTFRQNLSLTSGQTICSVEELSPDILPNQIIKSTLIQLQQNTYLEPAFHQKIQAFLPVFTSVQIISSDFQAKDYIEVPRYQMARYQFILNCCYFIQQNLLPLPGSREFTWKTLLRDKKQMGSIFEAFVRNFYRQEQATFQVKSEKIDWKNQGGTKEAKAFLPAMFTDISLQSTTRKIIIDTKYYKKALLPHYQKDKLHSKHLYQLFAYLQNSPVKHSGQIIEGMLLYPVVNKELNLEYNLSGNKVRICTVNLNQPWVSIKRDLLQLLA